MAPPWRGALLLCFLGVISQCTGQDSGCMPTGPDACPDGQRCNAGTCEPIPAPDVQNDMTAYIILGSVLGGVLIIIIIIVIISCGRWNTASWRNASLYAGRPQVSVYNPQPVKKPKKMKLKLGVKQNPFNTLQSDSSGTSKTLFVVGNDRDVSSMSTASTSSTAGPHVATVALDQTRGHVASTSVQHNQMTVTSPQPANMPVVQSIQPAVQPYSSNPNVTRVACPDVRQECTVSNPVMPAPAPAPAPAPIYPTLGAIHQPQHQIHIHAPVPLAQAALQHMQPMVHQPMAHQPMVHQPMVHQPMVHQVPAASLYPQIPHVHGHVISNSAPHLGPPAYETMQRKF